MTAYYIKFIDKNGKTITSKRTHNYRAYRIFARQEVRRITGIYIKFTYGKALDANGEHIVFSNEGTYKTKKEALVAINAFHEVENE